MRKLILVVMTVILAVTPAFALLDNTNAQQQGQGQAQGQGQQQGQGQAQSAVSNATSGSAAIQGQGQLGIVSQGNNQSVGGDTTKNTVYATTWPNLSGGVGVSQGNVYSVFGGIGVSSTEEYKVCIEKLMVIDTLVKLGYLSTDEAKAEVKEILSSLKYNTNTKRFLGIFWKTSGRNLLNGLGLLSWDSFWKEGKTPVDGILSIKLPAPKKTEDKDITGNGGNLL